METFDGGKKMKREQEKFLRGLAKQYPTISAAASEIINLQAILSLPKGTEHFITDVHGEYDQFQHIIKNGSGAIRRKIEENPGEPQYIFTEMGVGYRMIEGDDAGKKS